MSKYVIEDTTLSGIADAIRAKTGKTDSMTPEQMPAEISGITGGKEEQVKTVTITENGSVTVMPDDGKALSSVEITVAVESAGELPADVHTVTFMNGDTVLYQRHVADGDTCADPIDRGFIETPTKESTAQYDYTYYGWGASDNGAADSTILQNITEDKTVYAIYTATVKYYTITWLDDDRTTVLKTESLAYGSTPSYTPTKDGYKFTGWEEEVVSVTGDATYTATWVDAVAGQCGSAAYWELDIQTGVLRVYGEGVTYTNSNGNAAPTAAVSWWLNYVDVIKTIIVEDGITRLCKGIFARLTNVTSITLPNSLETIDGYVFYSTGITSITIPDSVVNIYAYAFYGISGITSIAIPDSVTNIGDYAFYQCTKLTSVTIGSGVAKIGRYAFWTQLAVLASATFADTEGWYVTQTYNATSGTDLSAENLAKTGTAATYLDTTYVAYYWYKS